MRNDQSLVRNVGYTGTYDVLYTPELPVAIGLLVPGRPFLVAHPVDTLFISWRVHASLQPR